MIGGNDIGRLAAMAHALRPDWPVKSVATYLHATHAKRGYRDLAVALAWVAADPSTKTPKRLEENGPWWLAAVAGDVSRNATTTAPHIDSLRCSKCGAIKPEGDEKHREHCGKRADPHEGAAKAKAEIKATVRFESGEQG